MSGYRIRHSHSVLMIIDAMRLDFAMQPDSMKYFTKLLRNDDACLYHLKVQPPTVTLPRIKVKNLCCMPDSRLIFQNIMRYAGYDFRNGAKFHRCRAQLG